MDLSTLGRGLQSRHRGRMRGLLAAMLAAGVLSACGGTDGGTAVEDGGPVAESMQLTVLHINDHHSNLDASSLTLKLADSSGDEVDATVSSAGFARVTAAIKALAQDSDNVITLHAGDALTGTLYFNRAGEIGEADAALMNTVCFDSFTLGNHEFDKGDTELKNFIDRLHDGDCQTPVISANVNFGEQSALHPSKAPGYVQPYTILERAGQQIGVVGLTVAQKTKQSSSPDADTTFRNELEAAQEAIDALHAQGVNKIIVSSHIGYSMDKQLAAQLSGVDVIIGGDSHTLLGPDALADIGVGTPMGPYAETLTNADGDLVCLGQAWEYAQVVGQMQVSFDAEGVVTACEGTPHVLIGDDWQIANEPATPADQAALAAAAQATGFLYSIAPDPDALKVLAPFQEKVDVYSRQVVAIAPQELCSRRVPGGDGSMDYGRSSAACIDIGQVNERGGDIQQLVAQAYLDVANAEYGGAEISLQSGGGVRIPLEGNITAANVIEVLPFGNMLFRLDITGTEAKAMVEDGLQATFGPGGSTGPYPYTGGMRFKVNASQPQGQRASDFEVLDQGSGLWVPLDPAKTYRLFVLSFNAEGGDGYETLANIPDERRLDIGVLDADVFQTYIDGLPRDSGTGLPIIQPLDHQYYSTQSFTGP